MKKLIIAVVLVGVVGLSGCGPTLVQQMEIESQNRHKMYSEQKIKAVHDMAAQTKIFYDKNGPEQTISKAEDVVKSQLKDPNSAIFQNTRVIDYGSGKIVCGLVNSKNSYGGYVGSTPFVAGVDDTQIYQDSDTLTFNAGIKDACSNK